MKLYKDYKPEILIAAFGIITYAISLANTFHTDDWIVLSLLRDGFSWRDFLSMENMGRFRPLTNIFVYFRYLAFGDAPFGYYALNIILHVFLSILLYRFLKKIGLKPVISLLSAIIFTVYFQHYEAVLWLYGTIRILGAIVWIACLWNLNNYLVLRKRLALMFFAIYSFLGYFIVEDFVVSPLGFLAFALLIMRRDKALDDSGTPRRRIPWDFIWRPILISSIGLAVYFTLRTALILRPGVVEDYYYLGPHILLRLFAYLEWMLLPPPNHPYFQDLAIQLSPIFITAWLGLSIAMAVVLILASIYLLIKSSPKVKFFILFILIALLPALPLDYKVTSRNIYIPSIGLSVLLGFVFFRIYERLKVKNWGKRIAYTSLSFYLIVNIAAVCVTSYEYHKNQMLVASLVNDLKDSGVKLNKYDYVLIDHLPGRTVVGPAMIYKLGFTHEVIASNDPSVPVPNDIQAVAKDIVTKKIPFVVFDYRNGHLLEVTSEYINRGP